MGITKLWGIKQLSHYDKWDCTDLNLKKYWMKSRKADLNFVFWSLKNCSCGLLEYVNVLNIYYTKCRASAPCGSNYFLVFWPTPDSAQGLFLDLHSKIILRVEGPHGVLRKETCCLSARQCPIPLCYYPGSLLSF